MSVCLLELSDEFGVVELWANEYDGEHYWLCDDEDNRIDLSRQQLADLFDWKSS